MGALNHSTELSETFSLQRKKSIQLRNSSCDYRIRKLLILKEWIKTNAGEIEKAIYADFRKAAAEVAVTETGYVLMEINLAVQNLKKWMAPKKASTPFYLLGTKSQVHYEPKGTVLIISPWNFPFNLSIGPLVSAIAAGCTAFLKPSELTPHSAALIRRMAAEIFTKEEVAVFEGDATMAQKLLSFPFNHIYFTGSPSNGKMVMSAAAQHLSSVTLELGGKSPVIVDRGYDLRDAVQKIAVGKWVNCGQTCIAPDYLLVHESQKEELIEALIAQVNKMYPSGSKGLESNKDYGRIINSKHLRRLQNMLADAQTKGAHVYHGGKTLSEENFMEPTIISGMSEDMLLMQEEIFGPILPVLSYHKLEEVKALLHHKPKPLSLYLFSENDTMIEQFIKETSAGTVAINDCGIQYLQNELPFGGIGQSGMGKAHGHAGFLAFSNEKAVIQQRIGKSLPKLLYPPYDFKTSKISSGLLGWLLRN
ncbi:aldehyde dehydrogenase family protein [Echinicola sediminis]